MFYGNLPPAYLIIVRHRASSTSLVVVVISIEVGADAPAKSYASVLRAKFPPKVLLLLFHLWMLCAMR
jgi:hypothetical protein